MDPTTLTDEQIAIREGRITGSRIGAVCGLNPDATALDVYLEMRGEGPPRTVNEHMKRGIFLEDGIRNWTAHNLGIRIEKTPTVIHPDYDWIAASPDGAAYQDDDLIAAMEIKCPSPYSPRIHDWGDPTEQADAIPSCHIPQCVWEAGCLSAPETICSALIGGVVKIYRIPYKQQLFDRMAEIAEPFLKRVKEGRPPPLDGSASAARWLADQFPHHTGVTYIQADDRIMEHIEGLARVTAQMKALDADKLLAQNMIKKWLGSNPGLTSPHGRISWKVAARNQLKQKELVEWMKANHPEELSNFYEKRESRRFVATLK